MRVIKVLVAAAAFVCALATPAFGQEDPYPGGSGPKDPKPTQETQQNGPHVLGATFTVESCGFQPGSVAAKSWNGAPSGTSTADAAGCVTVNVQFVERQGASGATGCQVDALVDGQRHAANAGRNELTVLGTGSNGAAREVVNQVVLQCNAGGGETPRSLARVDDGRFGDSSLARTGGLIARWTAVGMLLVAIGFGLVVLERRRLARR